MCKIKQSLFYSIQTWYLRSNSFALINRIYVKVNVYNWMLCEWAENQWKYGVSWKKVCNNSLLQYIKSLKMNEARRKWTFIHHPSPLALGLPVFCLSFLFHFSPCQGNVCEVGSIENLREFFCKFFRKYLHKYFFPKNLHKYLQTYLRKHF